MRIPRPGELGRVGQRMGERVEGARQLRRARLALMPPPPRVFAAFGERSVIVPPARVEQPESIAIGRGVLIHEHAWLLARPAAGTGAALVVGDRTVINRCVKIVCLGQVTIGDDCIIGDHAYLSDVEYELSPFDVPPEHRSLTVPQPVVLEPGAALGVGVVVKPGVTIGERAYVGAGAIVTKDVPAGCLAIGAPARVVRRFE